MSALVSAITKMERIVRIDGRAAPILERLREELAMMMAEMGEAT